MKEVNEHLNEYLSKVHEDNKAQLMQEAELKQILMEKESVAKEGGAVEMW